MNPENNAPHPVRRQESGKSVTTNTTARCDWGTVRNLWVCFSKASFQKSTFQSPTKVPWKETSGNEKMDYSLKTGFMGPIFQQAIPSGHPHVDLLVLTETNLLTLLLNLTKPQ